MEFENPQIAEKVLKEYNKKNINGHVLKLNWTKLIQKNVNFKYNDTAKDNVNKIYTVYISNLAPDAKEEELYNYLKQKFNSLISCKIIFDSHNCISKGFGFADFSDIKEYNFILKNNKKFIFKDKELTIK